MRTDFDAQWDELAEEVVEREMASRLPRPKGHAPPDRSGAGQALRGGQCSRMRR